MHMKLIWGSYTYSIRAVKSHRFVMRNHDQAAALFLSKPKVQEDVVM